MSCIINLKHIIYHIYIAVYTRHEMDEQECQWLTTPSEDLRCIICLCVAQEPHQHGRCGKLFCRLCAQQLFKEHRDYQNLAKFKMEAHSLSDQAIVVSDN